MNYHKHENENLVEQMNQMEMNYEKLENDNNQMLKIRDELIASLDKVIKRIDYENNLRNSRNDLVNIFHLLLENSNIVKSQSTSNTNVRSSIDENILEDKNLSGDENSLNISNKIGGKRASYVTQNYEKFKQSQDAVRKGPNENKFINQSKEKLF